MARKAQVKAKKKKKIKVGTVVPAIISEDSIICPECETPTTENSVDYGLTTDDKLYYFVRPCKECGLHLKYCLTLDFKEKVAFTKEVKVSAPKGDKPKGDKPAKVIPKLIKNHKKKFRTFIAD